MVGVVTVVAWVAGTVFIALVFAFLAQEECGPPGARGTPTSEGCHPFGGSDLVEAAALAAVPPGLFIALVLVITVVVGVTSRKSRRSISGVASRPSGSVPLH